MGLTILTGNDLQTNPTVKKNKKKFPLLDDDKKGLDSFSNAFNMKYGNFGQIMKISYDVNSINVLI